MQHVLHRRRAAAAPPVFARLGDRERTMRAVHPCLGRARAGTGAPSAADLAPISLHLAQKTGPSAAVRGAGAETVQAEGTVRRAITRRVERAARRTRRVRRRPGPPPKPRFLGYPHHICRLRRR